MKKTMILLLMIFIIGIGNVGAEVVIIGGYGSTMDELKFMKEKFPNAAIIIPVKFMPLEVAADFLYKQFMEKRISGSIIIVAHSWGGLLARELVARNYPEIDVKKIILIGTPNAGHWITPWFIYAVSEYKKEIPLFVIAGNKGAKKWYLKNDSNDGVVDVSSALAVEKAEETKIFHLNHYELIHNDLVAEQIKSWIEID